MKVHESVTLDRVIKAVERQSSTTENPGICIACGEDDDSCDPDTRGKECEACGKRAVYGSFELLNIVS